MDTSTPIPVGNPFGYVEPPRAVPPFASVDPRTTALRLLGRYIAGLTFFRPGAKDGQTIPFTITTDRFLVEEGDGETDVVFPCIVVLSESEETYNNIGLNSDYDEPSADKYGIGTVLQVQYEQTEFLFLELWCSSKPERRSLIAGLQSAMNPTESQYGIRFIMADYFDQFVSFTLWSTKRLGFDVVRNRYRARVKVEMRFNVVSLVNYNQLQAPQVYVETLPEEVPLDGMISGPESLTRAR